jgi:hypothetical protein
MSLTKQLDLLLSASALLLGAMTAAHADVVISTDPTSNMYCASGVCTPTAADAALNVSDLESYLAAGSLEVTTTGSGVQANNIDVSAPFSWSAANTLTLDAYDSITVTGSVTDSGAGGVTLVTNDGGSGGALSFISGGAITIANLKDVLTINGLRYTLAGKLKDLARDIAINPNHAFALANDIDASGRGIYRAPPIPVYFGGSFNGLGHVISNLVIADQTDLSVGLFAGIAAGAEVSSIGIVKVHIDGGQDGANAVGALAGTSNGTITNAWSDGEIRGGQAYTGGLLGDNEGVVENSWSSAGVQGNAAGGLVGYNGYSIDSSFAEGTVSGGGFADSVVGGLVGYSKSGLENGIENSYAIGRAFAAGYAIGGLAGQENDAPITSAYSAGHVQRGGKYVGGFLGYNTGTSDKFCYWDISTNKGLGAVGQGSNSGMTGLTTAQFQSGLPTGFDPTIWAEDPSINNGFPYLIANPPPQ